MKPLIKEKSPTKNGETNNISERWISRDSCPLYKKQGREVKIRSCQ